MARKATVNQTLQGVAVSPGIAIGKAYLVDRRRVEVPRFSLLDERQVPQEKERFQGAVKRSQADLREIRHRIRGSIMEEHLQILDAHIRMLQDRTLLHETLRSIEGERINAEWALSQALEKFRSILMGSDDEYLRSRVADLDFVGQRILRHLKGETQESIAQIQEEVIVVAHDLSPADTAQMNKDVIKAFVTDMGGRTSHTAIMARSLEIPAVVGLESITDNIQTGGMIIVDGVRGIVVVDPASETLEEYLERRRHYRVVKEELLSYACLPGETMDGYQVTVKANIEIVDEVPSVLSHGAEGIGLYRTEFLYMNREDLPGEEDLYHTYREVVERISPLSVTIRTLDIGGDKLASVQEGYDETNPAMGLRAIRFSLREVEIFKTQLRGILRASAHGKIRIMFPMISGVREIHQVKEILERVKGELRERGQAFDPEVPIGVMVEVPSAASVADFLAQEVEFFSIGTNDLIQYALAIDRVNEHVIYLYEPLHPGVLRMIKTVVDAGHRAGIPVSMCGEMAGEHLYVPILLGLGLDELSMNTLAIPLVKKVIRSLTLKDSNALTERVLELGTAEEIRQCVLHTMSEWFPEEYESLFLDSGR